MGTRGCARGLCSHGEVLEAAVDGGGSPSGSWSEVEMGHKVNGTWPRRRRERVKEGAADDEVRLLWR